MEYFGHGCFKAHRTPWGEFAWRIEDIPYALDKVATMQGVILGGDVITESMEHTYDNWYYTPICNETGIVADAIENSIRSIQYANKYITHFAMQHGNQFMYTLVVQTKAEFMLWLAKSLE